MTPLLLGLYYEVGQLGEDQGRMNHWYRASHVTQYAGLCEWSASGLCRIDRGGTLGYTLFVSFIRLIQGPVYKRHTRYPPTYYIHCVYRVRRGECTHGTIPERLKGAKMCIGVCVMQPMEPRNLRTNLGLSMCLVGVCVQEHEHHVVHWADDHDHRVYIW